MLAIALLMCALLMQGNSNLNCALHKGHDGTARSSGDGGGIAIVYASDNVDG
jgi:hypothetical protein